MSENKNEEVLKALRLVNNAYNIINLISEEVSFKEIAKKLFDIRNEISWLYVNE